MLKTEIAELMGKDGAENTLYEVAQKVEYGYDKLNAEEKEVFELKSDDVSFDYETVVHKGLEGIE